MGQSAPRKDATAIAFVGSDPGLVMSREEYEANLHAKLVVEVSDLHEQAVMMRRRFMNSWIHHPEYSLKLVTLPEWAEALGVTRYAAYALRRRHSDFPQPIGSFGGTMIFDREVLDLWFQSKQARRGNGG